MSLWELPPIEVLRVPEIPTRRHLMFSMFTELLREEPRHELSEAEETEMIDAYLVRQEDDCQFSALCVVYGQVGYASTRKRLLDVFIAFLTEGERYGRRKRTLPARAMSASLENMAEHASVTCPASGFDPQKSESFWRLVDVFPNIYRLSDEHEKYMLSVAFCRLFTAMAPDSRKEGVNLLDLDLYKKVIVKAREVVEMINTGIIDKKAGHDFMQKMVTLPFTVLTNMSTMRRATLVHRESMAMYIGELVTVIAGGVSAIEGDSKICVQQFWLGLIIVTGNIFKTLRAWKQDIVKLARFVDPLVDVAGFKSYDHGIKYVETAMRMVDFDMESEGDDIGVTINSMVRGIRVGTVASMKPSEAYLLLAIICLEKGRVISGDLVSFFSYFEVDYGGSFGLCMDALFQVLFNLYMRSFERLDASRKKQSLHDIAQIVFRGYSGVKQRTHAFIQQIANSPLLDHDYVLFCPETIEAFVAGFQETLDMNHAGYEAMGRKLFAKGVSMSKNMMFALLSQCFVNKIARGEADSLSIYGVTALLPAHVRDNFMVMFSKVTMVYGGLAQGMILGPGEIDVQYRVLFEAACIVRNKDVRRVTELLSPGIEPGILCIGWAHIMLEEDLEEVFMMSMIHQFMTHVSTGEGIFSQLTFDPEMVRYQQEVMLVLTEHLTTGGVHRDIIDVFQPMTTAQMNEDPGAYSCLLVLGKFVITALMHCVLTANTAWSCSRVLMHVVLRIVAMRLSPNVFRYVTNDTNELLVFIIQNLREAAAKSTVRDSSVSMTKGGLRDVLVRHQQRTYAVLGAKQELYEKLVEVVKYALCHSCSANCAYADDKVGYDRIMLEGATKPRSYYLDELLPLIWELHAPAIPAIADALMIRDQVIPVVRDYFKCYPYELAFSRNMVETMAEISIEDLAICGLVSPWQAVGFLTPDVLSHPVASSYWIRCIDQMKSDEIVRYIPQFVQALRMDSQRVLSRYLQLRAKKSPVVAHALLWNIMYEKSRENEPEFFRSALIDLERLIDNEMSREEAMFREHEFYLVDQLAQICESLFTVKPENRKDELQKRMEELTLSDDMYIPSHPSYRIVNVSPRDCTTLQSHARVPILVTFAVYDTEVGRNKVFGFKSIFKVQDDVRMDAMMILLIDKLQRIFDDAGLDTYMNPYRIMATGGNRGVIECIRNAKSRHEMGGENNQDLLHYFIYKHGQVGTEHFKRAQQNFINSMAPYSLLCYMFQVKDRHNANIMFDDDGHILHIDFGFIFEIAPGNVKFESAFKFTAEMVQLMGGRDSVQFRQFEQLFVRCFLAARARYREIEPIATLMKDAGFPCFLPDSFKWLAERMFLNKPELGILPMIKALITDSIGSVRTGAYDKIQYVQNGIWYC